MSGSARIALSALTSLVILMEVTDHSDKLGTGGNDNTSEPRLVLSYSIRHHFCQWGAKYTFRESCITATKLCSTPLTVEINYSKMIYAF